MFHLKSQSGISLVEVLVAVVLIGTAVAALLASLAYGISMQHLAEMAARASDLAGEGIEQMRAYLNAHDFSGLISMGSQPIEGSPGFNRALLVVPSGSMPHRVWTVTSIVTYAVKGTERSASFQTVLSEP